MYEIIIKETFIEKVEKGQNWVIVAERFPTKEDFDSSMYSGLEMEKKNKVLNGEFIKFNKYGYTPTVIGEKETSKEIYRQTVDELNLNEVIKAVNNISYNTTKIE